MTKYVCLVKLRLESFMAWKLKHIPRDSNKKADALATVAASLPTKEIVLLPVYFQSESSIATNRLNEIEKAYPSRMTPRVRYLSSGELSNSRVEAHKIQVQAARFSLMNGQFYKRSLDGPYLPSRGNMHWRNSMKEYTKTILVVELWRIRPIPRATTSQP